MLLDLALTVHGSHQGHGAQKGDMNPLYWRPVPDCFVPGLKNSRQETVPLFQTFVMWRV